MIVIPVNLAQEACRIVIGSPLLSTSAAAEELAAVVRDRKCLMVTDALVGPLYGAAVAETLHTAGAAEVYTETFAPGEPSKTLVTVESLYHAGVAAGLERSSAVVALGGGVVGDVAGFFAATFLRGITLVQVPTTLLALVDSSVGGKVGVDLPEGKNLVGAFHQARLVLGEVAVLTTLPVREVRNGLAEVIKYGIIMDNELFTLLETAADRLVPPDLPLYEQVVSRCCTLKARVVEQDEKETGLRAILNYGHTFAHALETVGEFRALRHGEAVSVGMGMAADLAARTGACAPEVGRRLDALLEPCGLPRRLERLPGITPQAVLDCMYRDKKVRAGRLRLVLPREIGAVELVEWRDRDVLLRAIGGRIG